MSCVTIFLTGRHAGSITSVPSAEWPYPGAEYVAPAPSISWACAATVYVGNGGISLRRIAGCRHFVGRIPGGSGLRKAKPGLNEHMFFAVFGELSRQLPSPRCAWPLSLPGTCACRAHPCPVSGTVADGDHGYREYDPISSLTQSCPPLLV